MERGSSARSAATGTLPHVTRITGASQGGRKFATLLLMKRSLAEHRQLSRQEMSTSIIHGKRRLLYEFIPKHGL